jgi:Tfp pilus assembly protein PilN
MTEQVERIAVLEAEVSALKDDQKEILKCMHEIRDEMTRYKGFLGGVAFLISGLSIFFTLFKDWFFKHFN